jgi:tRNA(Ile)-lysidine synthase TilS/MesJ
MNFISRENISQYRILRPLINIPKNDIKKLCDINYIKYFEDYTNQDETISQRNFIRKNIIKKIDLLKKDNLFFSSFYKIYNSLEENY